MVPPSRRQVLVGIGALGVGTLAGCVEPTTTETVNETLRYGYDITFEDDQMAVNVDGTIGDVSNWPDDVAVIKVRVLVDGEVRARKTVRVRVTDKRTDWGVAVLLPRTDGDVAVEAEATAVVDPDEEDDDG